MRSLPDIHRDALAATGRIVANIKPDQLHDATPCDEYDVAGLLNHLISGNFWVAPLVEGKTIGAVGSSLDRDYAPDEYPASADAAERALSSDGAMERPVAVSYGPVPGEVYAGHRFIDVFIHGWDLATATGQDTKLDPELVEACWTVINPQMELLAGSGMFGSRVDVPDTADPQTRLLAALGRRA